MTTTPTTPPLHHRLSLPGLLACSLPGLPLGALAVALSVYLPRYYAGHFGVGLSAVGIAFMAVRLIDMAFDPVIGIMMDRTRTRFGRYRVWLIVGAPILMIAVYMLFLPPAVPHNGLAQYGYLIGWLFVYYIGTSVIGLSHASWASVIAAKYHERSRVFGAIQVVSIIAATVVLIVPTLMHSHSAAGDVRAMGWFIVIVTPIGVALAVLRTPEKMVQEVHGEKFGLRDYWEMIARPDMRRIIIADFCLALGPGWMSAIYLFYFHDSRGFSYDSARFLLAIYIIAGVVGAAGLSWLAMRLGKHRTLQLGTVLYAICQTTLMALPANVYWPSALGMFCVGASNSCFGLMIRAMLAAYSDQLRLEQGVQRVSLLYSFVGITLKLGTSLNTFIAFSILNWVGFQASEDATNTPQALFGLEMVYLFAPIVFVFIGGLFFFGYELDEKRHAEIRRALDERDAGLAEAGP